MSRLQNVKRILWKNVRRNDSEWLRSLCALSAGELLFACGDESVSALSLHTGQLVERAPTALSNVWRVAFDSSTDTLILLAESTYNWQLVSLCREASEWREVQRLNTSLRCNRYRDTVVMAVCDSRVLLAGVRERTLYEFDVSAAHNLSAAGSVANQSAIFGLTCTRRDNDTLVAIAHWDSVSLQRLVTGPLRLEQIATSLGVYPHQLAPNPFGVPQPMLFRGELLVVADFKHDAIVSFRATNSALTEWRVLRYDSFAIRHWTLAGHRLVLADWGSNLHVYDFE